MHGLEGDGQRHAQGEDPHAQDDPLGLSLGDEWLEWLPDGHVPLEGDHHQRERRHEDGQPLQVAERAAQEEAEGPIT